MDNLEDDLEKELLNYNEMSSSIEKIKNSSTENKELFKDLDTFSSIKKSNKTLNNNKNFDVNNFVQELENNLDNFDIVDKNIAPNRNFNKINKNFTEKIINFEDDKNYEDSEDSEKSEDNTDNINYNKELKEGYEIWNNKIYDLLINIKEPLIVVLIFI